MKAAITEIIQCWAMNVKVLMINQRFLKVFCFNPYKSQQSGIVVAPQGSVLITVWRTTRVPALRATNSTLTERIVMVNCFYLSLAYLIKFKYTQKGKYNCWGMRILMDICVAEVWFFCFLHLRHQRVSDGSQRLPGRRALHQHRRLLPVSERGQLRDRLRTHRQQQLQRSAPPPP